MKIKHHRLIKTAQKILMLTFLSSLWMGANAAASTSATPSSPAISANSASSKTYNLNSLQVLINNNSQCMPLYQALLKATTGPLTLQFSPHPTEPHFLVSDSNSSFENHHFYILKQKIQGTYIQRIGMGYFDLNKLSGFDQKQINYVIQISVDTQKNNFKYSYPLILSSDHGQCAYTAVLVPDTNTISKFKGHIQSGDVAAKTDLIK